MASSESSPAFVALVQASAGAAGGVFASLVLMPLEVIKTRIQISQVGSASTLGTMREILAAEGVGGLWRGTTAKCTETGSKNFVYFYIYDAFNTAVKRRTKITTPIKLGLGYVAGVINTTLTMPLEVVATRLQAEGPAGRGFISVLWSILDTDGLEGLFRGFWFNMALCVNPAIQNTCFDSMKESLLRSAKKSGRAASLSPLQAFVLGAVAKALATVVTFPLVRLKTMLQAGKRPLPDTKPVAAGPQALERKASVPKLLKKISFRQDVAEDDQGPLRRLAQLYRGVGSALYKSVLQAALLYMTKDQVEHVVVRVFKLSARALRRRSGRVKLGAFSGRPLAS